MTDCDVVRVSCGPRGGYGNELGSTETVFVDDPERGVIDVHTPALRLPFAGHPCVGAARLLGVPELVTPAGVVGARQDGEFCWIGARAERVPPRALRQYATAAEVDDLVLPPKGVGAPPKPFGQWGRVYARAREDEATGSAALLLTDRPGRALNTTQGAGSRILTAPRPHGWTEIGGRVLLER